MGRLRSHYESMRVAWVIKLRLFIIFFKLITVWIQIYLKLMSFMKESKIITKT